MSRRLCVIDLPGLSHAMVGRVPRATALGKWLCQRTAAPLTPSFPAVTCSVQATLTTGTPPSRHGIIANGLATFRNPADADLTDPDNYSSYRRTISFWEQSNQFVQAPRFWQDPDGRSRYPTALLFFQHSMPGFTGEARPAADIVLTPKPDHGPDGKLTSLCWSEPPELMDRLTAALGAFPLMNYWGPLASIQSSQWIAQAGAFVWREHRPTLQLTYVPHLDYDLQRFGPDSSQATQALEDLAVALDPLVRQVLDDGGKLALLSDYAISAVHRPLPINRWLREAGLLKVRPHADGSLMDVETSDVVAMVDHQVAHLYTRNGEATAAVRELLQGREGVELLDRRQQQDLGLNHARSGDLVAVAPPEAWFDYRWWSDPADAPVFARTVDIHRKPGFDPLELFFEPADKAITQDAQKVRGSHGRLNAGEAVLVSDLSDQPIHAVQVAAHLSRLLGGGFIKQPAGGR